MTAIRQHVSEMREFWITPPKLLTDLRREFPFDFDPCPYPRGRFNGLAIPWGRCNWVNPPFNKKDAPFGGPSSFVRKAIAEQAQGNTSVLILPLPWNLGLLMNAGAELRYAGIVRWLDAKSGEECPRRAPQVLAILRGVAP